MKKITGLLKRWWNGIHAKRLATRTRELKEEAEDYIRIIDDKLFVGNVAVFTIGDKNVDDEYVLCPSDAYKFLEHTRRNYINKHN